MSTRERLDLESMVAGVAIACEANGHQGYTPAMWVVRQVRCCQRKTLGFACDECLQRHLARPRATCDACGTTKEPARLWISSYEPINFPASSGD